MNYREQSTLYARYVGKFSGLAQSAELLSGSLGHGYFINRLVELANELRIEEMALHADKKVAEAMAMVEIAEARAKSEPGLMPSDPNVGIA